MSQIQSAEVVNVLSITGSDTRSRSASIASFNTRPPSRQLDDFSALYDLVRAWHKIKDRRSLDFCWRDGLEYQIIKLDHSTGQAILCSEQLKVLRRIERANARLWAWRPGFAKFTIEATTLAPYTPQLEDLLGIERNFIRRRKYLRSLLNNDQVPFTLSILPDLEPGKPHPHDMKKSKAEPAVPKYIIPQRNFSVHMRSASQGNLRLDSSISAPSSPTSRFAQLSRPRLRSVVTSENLSTLSTTAPAPVPASEAYGGEPNTRGLQVTFGCHDLREARYLHDQLCVLSPIMLAFTASTPVFRGRISEFDVRLRHHCKSTSDTKTGEVCSLARPWRSLYPTYLGNDAPKSRLTRSTTNKEVFQFLRAEGLDDGLATFIAQGFTCTAPPPVKPSNDFNETPPTVSGLDFFHDITTSLNPHVHLELPWPNEVRIGYRVTFTAMEVQLTDFSNAACIFFIALLRFAILGFDLDFRLPPHMVAENVAKAHKQDSIITEKFWWRSVRWRANTFGFFGGAGGSLNDQPLTTDVEPTLESIDTIINGDPARPETVGLSGVLDAYLADVEDSNGSDMGDGYHNGSARSGMNDFDMATISRYLAFIRRRAKGTVWTDARLVRNFVTSHPDFRPADKSDDGQGAEETGNEPGRGVLTEGIWYDLVRRVEELKDGML